MLQQKEKASARALMPPIFLSANLNRLAQRVAFKGRRALSNRMRGGNKAAASLKIYTLRVVCAYFDPFAFGGLRVSK